MSVKKSGKSSRKRGLPAKGRDLPPEGDDLSTEGRDLPAEGRGLREQAGLTCEAVDVATGESMEVSVSLPSPELLQAVLREMWRYCHAYHISNSVSLGCQR